VTVLGRKLRGGLVPAVQNASSTRSSLGSQPGLLSPLWAGVSAPLDPRITGEAARVPYDPATPYLFALQRALEGEGTFRAACDCKYLKWFLYLVWYGSYCHGYVEAEAIRP
jgi:hypothetical protein